MQSLVRALRPATSRSVLGATASFYLLALLVGKPASAEEFRSGELLSPHSPPAQAVAHMGKTIREGTGGRHTIKVLAQLTGNTDNYTIEQVRRGALAMARVRLATFHSTVPITVVPSLPFLFTSTAHLRRTLDGPVGEEILMAVEEEGFVGLCFYDTGPRSFYSSQKAIKTASDLKGLRVRVQATDVWSKILRAVGATPTPVPYNMLYNSLKTRTVDAAEFDLVTYEDAHHYEVAKFYSVTEHSMAPSVLVFSRKVWDGLSKPDQALIRTAAKESVLYMRQLWDDYEPRARKAAVAAGAEIHTEIDRKTFSDVLVPAYAKFVTDQKVIDLIRRVQEDR